MIRPLAVLVVLVVAWKILRIHLGPKGEVFGTLMVLVWLVGIGYAMLTALGRSTY